MWWERRMAWQGTEDQARRACWGLEQKAERSGCCQPRGGEAATGDERSWGRRQGGWRPHPQWVRSDWGSDV